MSLPFARISTIAAPVRQLVTDALRAAIVEGTIAPGTRLVEKDLCELFGVSRPSVREALRQVESEGLIESLPNRGPVVTQLTPQDAIEIFQIRESLEPTAARLFAMNATDRQMIDLKKAAASLESAFKSEQSAAVLRAKGHFYEQLYAGSHNKLVGSILRNLNSRISILRRVSLSSAARAPKSMKEIWAVVEAVQRRDGDKAFSASLFHVQQAAKAALDQFLRTSDAASPDAPPAKVSKASKRLLPVR